VRGPYAATHGPAASLEVTRTAQWLGFLLALTELLHRSFAKSALASSAVGEHHHTPDPNKSQSLEKSSVLRC
jgi:hypothetical protein